MRTAVCHEIIQMCLLGLLGRALPGRKVGVRSVTLFIITIKRTKNEFGLEGSWPMGWSDMRSLAFICVAGLCLRSYADSQQRRQEQTTERALLCGAFVLVFATALLIRSSIALPL